MASSKPPNQPKDTPAQPPQPAPQGAAPDKDHPVFPDYASI
ncbi:hypothetical protein [Thalassovita mangrovi]|nr:hypothetical protein [Thalassovita mangrovi]